MQNWHCRRKLTRPNAPRRSKSWHHAHRSKVWPPACRARSASAACSIRPAPSFLTIGSLGGVAGYYVITPLVIGDGLPAVLIDRGWKARTSDEKPDAVMAPTGRVNIEGLAVARPSALLELGSAPKLEVPGFWQNLDYDAYEQATKRSVARLSFGKPAVRATRWPMACGANGHSPQAASRSIVDMRFSGTRWRR